MPDEVFNNKHRMADDEILAKVLFYDISPQLRSPATLASVDAANCFDGISHAIASLVFHALGSPDAHTKSMLTTVRDMKFFLRTAFGDSSWAAVHVYT